MADKKKPEDDLSDKAILHGVLEPMLPADTPYIQRPIEGSIAQPRDGVTFEKLARLDHDRNSFDCGDPEIDNFIKRYARKAMLRGDSLTMVAVQDNPNSTKAEILGYVTVVPVTYREGTGPAERLGVEGRDANALLIGKVGVDQKHQGKGLGTAMIASALSRAASVPGLDGVTIDPKQNSDDLRSRYEHMGFESAAETTIEGGMTMTMRADQIEPALERIAAKSNVMNFEGWRERLAERKAAKEAAAAGPAIDEGAAASVVQPKM
ncbi:MAG: GNAT family N-acetyltransferase [Pseudomonadota bacterium]